MVDGGLCNFRVLDCNSDNPGVVFPDPRNPLDPASRPVACPPRPNATNATDGTNVTIPLQPVLRVYYGTSCLLWRPDNGYGCHCACPRSGYRGPPACADASATSILLPQGTIFCRRSRAAAAFAPPRPRSACVATSRTLLLRVCRRLRRARCRTVRAPVIAARLPVLTFHSAVLSLSPGDIVTKLRVRPSIATLALAMPSRSRLAIRSSSSSLSSCFSV
jgi:hypothetical protein